MEENYIVPTEITLRTLAFESGARIVLNRHLPSNTMHYLPEVNTYAVAPDIHSSVVAALRGRK